MCTHKYYNVLYVYTRGAALSLFLSSTMRMLGHDVPSTCQVAKLS
jgi:hypothetical protein